MYSRAHLLIELQHNNLLRELPWGIEATPLSIFEWTAKVKGLKDTIWEGGIFKIYIKFDEHFNIRPPQVFFQTVPFHPNIDVTSGKPCIDFLDDNEQWNENYSLSMILVSLQTLLANPVVKNAVNLEAAQMLLNYPEYYYNMVKDCVSASQKVEAGDSISAKVRDKNTTTYIPQPHQTKAVKTVHVQHPVMLSFEDYHSTWCNVATSKPKAPAVNPLLDFIKNKDRQQNMTRSDLDEQVNRQIEDHNSLVHGIMKKKPSGEVIKAAKLAQLNKMKEIYLPLRQSPVNSHQDAIIDKKKPELQEDIDVNEQDADDLVQWTNNLNISSLDET